VSSRPRGGALHAIFGVACSLGAIAGPGRAGGGHPPIEGIEEPSGVTRAGDRLLVVGDDEAGVYFSLGVTGEETGLVPLDPTQLVRHPLTGGLAALDLEGIDVLPDGRVVVLSERFPALFAADGILVPYGRRFVELGGRGPEGVAVLRQDDGGARVAILWEGGYPEIAQLPPDVDAGVSRHALEPRVLVHRLSDHAEPREMGPADVEREVQLRVPKPPGEEPFAQRFRAPDLVWHRIDSGSGPAWGWIVLLSSGWGERPPAGSAEECALRENGAPLRWCHRLLQRFTVEGAPVGEPFDLDTVLPERVRTANWEGLGWFVRGEKLVLVYDESIAARRLDPQHAFVMDLPAGW
jgi:hypothetical protein